MSRRIEVYKIKRGDNLASPSFWNQRLEDIDLRLAAREDDAAEIDDAVDDMVTVALQRLNDVFTPLILDAQDRLNNLAATFSAESLSELTIGLGEKTIVLTEESATYYVYTDYVVIRYATAQDNAMIAQVVSFDRMTRELVVNVVSVAGSGTYSNWLIRIGTPPDTTHESRTDNPHQVTAAQVGAYTEAQTDTAISNAIGTLPPISNALLKANNLDDLPDALTARINLGLKALATEELVGSGMFEAAAFGPASPVIIDGGSF